jgi:L-lactate dehydrogenase complex protein LldF
MINGPRRAEESDGPEALYINWSTTGAARYIDRICRGAQLHPLRRLHEACPIYEATGGHAYGWVYPGPIGAVLTPC